MIRSPAARPALFALAFAGFIGACAPPMPASAAGKNAEKAKDGAAVAESVAARPMVPPPAPGVPAKSADEMRARLVATMPDVEFDSIRESALPGFFEVQRGSNYGYVSADGQYLLTGDLVNLATGEQVTEGARKGARLAELDKLGDSYIQFDPPGGKPQHVVTVFTDIDCGYCRKLHSELASYHALGIGIRYAFFPRQGPGSPSFAEAESVWCSTDRKAALTQAKAGTRLPPAPAGCKTPIQKEYDAGVALGLRGTPMMVLPDGEIVNGYVPAQALASRLASAGFPAAVGGSAASKGAP